MASWGERTRSAFVPTDDLANRGYETRLFRVNNIKRKSWPTLTDITFLKKKGRKGGLTMTASLNLILVQKQFGMQSWTVEAWINLCIFFQNIQLSKSIGCSNNLSAFSTSVLLVAQGKVIFLWSLSKRKAVKRLKQVFCAGSQTDLCVGTEHFNSLRWDEQIHFGHWLRLSLWSLDEKSVTRTSLQHPSHYFLAW